MLVLPDQPVAIEEKLVRDAMPPDEVVWSSAPSFCKEVAEFCFAPHHTVVGIEYRIDQRRFQRGVSCVERQQSLDIPVTGVLVPKVIDSLSVRLELIHRLSPCPHRNLEANVSDETK
jgi:hypothetical protein